jgi:hypothetical protein
MQNCSVHFSLFFSFFKKKEIILIRLYKRTGTLAPTHSIE